MPLILGAQCIEHVWVGPWRGRFAWTASEVSRPNRFVLTGQAITEDLPKEMLALLRDVPCRIEYTITGDAGGTHFDRVMTYPIEGWQGWLGQRMGFGTEISRLIDEALVVSKSWLENPLLQAPVAQVDAPELIEEADPLADAAVASLVGPSDDLSELERFLGALYRGDAPAEADAPTPQVARFLEDWRRCRPGRTPAASASPNSSFSTGASSSTRASCARRSRKPTSFQASRACSMAPAGWTSVRCTSAAA